jgi:hypothetical protein
VTNPVTNVVNNPVELPHPRGHGISGDLEVHVIGRGAEIVVRGIVQPLGNVLALRGDPFGSACSQPMSEACYSVLDEEVCDEVEELALGTEASSPSQTELVVDLAVRGLGVAPKALEALIVRIARRNLPHVLRSVEPARRL